MPRRIKKENGVNSVNVVTTLNGTSSRHNDNHHSTRSATPRPGVPVQSATSDSFVSPDRGRRSGAPTVDTRNAGQAAPPSSDTEGDDDLLLMEVRSLNVKPEAGIDDLNPFPSTTDGGDIDKNLKDIGHHLKNFNDTLGSLQQLGIHHDTPLPELILVGDQSSGKSSLMSAISQIILPRSDGVCTRCPIHIRLSSDTTWRCRVSLQQDYAYRPPNDEAITEADVTDKNPFPPWVQQQREVKEFKMIYNKSDPIDETVRWAQIAILNHNRNFAHYVPKDWSTRTAEERDPEYEAQRLAEAERDSEAKFSPNTVAIEVKGPGLPDLSFYDMPGVFRNAKHEEDQFLVKVVENLVRKYISHNKAIILWAVPMNHDPETSSTFTLIRRLKAQDRTIGVMTKADLLPRGGHPQWLAMLAGQQHQVGRGYFITSRAPPSAQNGDVDGQDFQRRDRQSLRDEHAAEEAFFNRQATSDRPWPPEFEEYDDRCGIDQLVKLLAQTLAQEFARNLPDLSKKLNSKLQSTRDHLNSLPEMPQNPEHEVRKSLIKFAGDFQSRLSSKTFAASWTKIAEDFKGRIIHLKPKYRVMPEGFSVIRDLSGGVSDRESVVSVNNSPSVSVKRNRPIDLTVDLSTPSTRRRRVENGAVKVEEPGNAFNFNSPSTAADSGRPRGLTLAMVRDLIRSERAAGKPGEVPYHVIELMCMDAIKPWIMPMNAFLAGTMRHLGKQLDESLDESFKELKKRRVYRIAKDFMADWLKVHGARISKQLDRIYKMETTKIYTMDDDAFQRHRAHELYLLKRNRHFYRWKQYMNDRSDEKIEDWEKMTPEARRKEEERIQKEQAKLGEDPYEVELEVSSKVRGYYLTAAMRFIDVIAMHITSGLFPDLEADIEQYLEKKMGMSGRVETSVFEDLMEEEQSTAEKRVRLKAELERFQKAVKEIQDLNTTVTRASANAPPHENGDDQDMDDIDADIDMDAV